MDILFFGNYLPYSKHFHIITSIPNIFFMNLEPMGKLAHGGPREHRALRRAARRGPDVEADARRLHVHRVRPLPRRLPDGADRQAARSEDLHRRRPRRGLRGDAGRSSPRAPAAATASASGGRRDLVGGWISEDTIWACTTCGFCTTACPVFIIPAVDKIAEMRRYLVLDKAEFPKEMQSAFRGMETNGNPWNISAASRGDWADGLPVATMAEAEGPRGRRPLLGRLRGLLRGPRQARLEGARRDPERGGRLVRDPRRRGDLHGRLGAAHGQRVPLPDAGAAERRDAQQLQGQEDRHELPALLQLPRQRVRRLRREVRGRARLAARRRADRRRAASS